MIPLTINLETDQSGAWADMREKEVLHLPPSALKIGTLTGGMASGKPSVAFRVDLPDGRIAFFETSVALFLMAADCIKARHGDPRT